MDAKNAHSFAIMTFIDNALRRLRAPFSMARNVADIKNVFLAMVRALGILVIGSW
jgi:hypothetical protein